MTVTVTQDGDGAGRLITLSGLCPVSDAEPLLAGLQAAGPVTVDISQAGHLHAAVVQALLAFAPRIAGQPRDEFAACFLLTTLQGGSRRDPESTA